MRDLRLPSLLAVALLAASCTPAPDPPGAVTPTPRAEAALVAGDEIAREALGAFEEARWDDAVAIYARALAAYGEGDDAVLGGSRDQALYNTACAHARAGRVQQAAETFAKSVASGLRPVVVPYAGGGWVETRALTLEHLLVDADLDPIRNEAAYAAALRPLLGAGVATVEYTTPEAAEPVPAVIVLAPEGDDGERARAAWQAAAKVPLALVVLAGPVRPTVKDRRWILGDGDERWAVAKVREGIDAALADPHVDKARVYVAGVGARPGEAAWAAAL